MILSYKHNFIFLKNKKVAGTSMEVALARVCGENDIITPIIEGNKPQNYLIKDKSGKVIFRYFSHMRAKSIKSLIGEEQWNKMFKFCFERHPCEKMISAYESNYNHLKRFGNIHNFIRSHYCKYMYMNDWYRYTIDNKVAVDYFGKYEELYANWKYICNLLKFETKLVLPKMKKRLSNYYIPWRERLNRIDIDYIFDNCKQHLYKNNMMEEW